MIREASFRSGRKGSGHRIGRRTVRLLAAEERVPQGLNAFSTVWPSYALVHCCSKSKPWSATKRTGFAVASPNRPTDTSVSISGVPTICRFFGITITMYFDDHDPPHFHARHASDGAKIEIGSLEIMDSTLERRQLRFVLAWAELHQDELLANWRRARAGETLEDIEPLR
jgi:hypothetical protein